MGAYSWTNDQVEEAHRLGFTSRFEHVNLIPLNPTLGYNGVPTAMPQAQQLYKPFKNINLQRYEFVGGLTLMQDVDNSKYTSKQSKYVAMHILYYGEVHSLGIWTSKIIIITCTSKK